jgi:segregation and condensation protein A
MPHEVKLEVFTGPIDLLLHLITRQRVDIYEVSIATITEEYLAAIERRDDLDLESATGFLVVAATLLELKSLRLLPARRLDDIEGSLLEERDLLLARLVECATYREAGSFLRAGLAAGERSYARKAGLEDRFVHVAPDLLANATLGDLSRAAARCLAPKPQLELDTSHVAPIVVSVRDAIVELSGRLEGGVPVTFSALCRGRSDRIEVIVRFLALLELFKANAVTLDQADRWGDIVVVWSGDADLEAALEDAEEYMVEVEGAS